MATKKRRAKKTAKRAAKTKKPMCFVVMPISDQEGYAPGHFTRVFEDIFAPACDDAGYEAVRADQIRETNLIHLDVLQKLLDSPIALCDLSSRNPNVLFELGLRQAFDKSVVLVQEAGTQPIFDIAPLRYTLYRRSRTYHEVLEDRDAISQAIRHTAAARDSGQGVNSLVKLLALAQPAALPEVQDAEKNPALQLIRAELEELRFELRNTARAARHAARFNRAPYPVVSDKMLGAALNDMPPEMAEVFVLLSGVTGDRPRSEKQVAEMLRIPPIRIRRLHDQARARISRFMDRAPAV